MECLHSWYMCQCSRGVQRGCLKLLSFPSSFRHHDQALVGQEQVMLFLTIVNVKVLNAHFQFLHLELGAFGPIESLLSTVPAWDISYWWQDRANQVLHKCHPIVVWIPGALLPSRHLVVVQQTRCLNNGLWEVVLSLCHVVCKISLQLIVPVVVGSS